mmetsp:Transcript_8329/g.16823  ORF Transcript_8329/g.16823 Transcript_8329/m.16823 type:complete len:205 (+) Transcript_8329:233-847(+)
MPLTCLVKLRNASETDSERSRKQPSTSLLTPSLNLPQHDLSSKAALLALTNGFLFLTTAFLAFSMVLSASFTAIAPSSLASLPDFMKDLSLSLSFVTFFLSTLSSSANLIFSPLSSSSFNLNLSTSSDILDMSHTLALSLSSAPTALPRNSSISFCRKSLCPLTTSSSLLCLLVTMEPPSTRASFRTGSMPSSINALSSSVTIP